jgi:pyruvate ferredoxin oxidoreductase gamma subunit
VILNTRMSAQEARKVLKVPATVKVATVDASGIALATIKRDIPNTPIVGALSAVTGVVLLEQVKEKLIATFGKKFSQQIIDANLESVTRAYEEVEVA